MQSIIDYDNLFALADEAGAQQKKQELIPLMKRIMAMPHREWCLEIGSYNGGTARVLSKLFSNVISIDIEPQKGWDGLRKTNHNWMGIVADSQSEICLSFFKALGIEFDFIFIDGDHTYDGCLADFLRYTNFLAPDGIVAFHDILETRWHHDNNCRVDQVWSAIKRWGFTTEEFVFTGIGYTGKFQPGTAAANWGGIGIVLNSSPKSKSNDIHFVK